MESNKIFIVLKYIKVSIKKIATYMESNTIFIVRINEENLITFSCLFCEKSCFLYVYFTKSAFSLNMSNTLDTALITIAVKVLNTFKHTLKIIRFTCSNARYNYIYYAPKFDLNTSYSNMTSQTAIKNYM